MVEIEQRIGDSIFDAGSPASDKHYIHDDGFSELRKTFNEAFQREHGRRVAERARVNGQPNGYRPISEAELQARKASLHYAEMARVMDEELAA